MACLSGGAVPPRRGRGGRGWSGARLDSSGGCPRGAESSSIAASLPSTEGDAITIEGDSFRIAHVSFASGGLRPMPSPSAILDAPTAVLQGKFLRTPRTPYITAAATEIRNEVRRARLRVRGARSDDEAPRDDGLARPAVQDGTFEGDQGGRAPHGRQHRPALREHRARPRGDTCNPCPRPRDRPRGE